ncbi:MAG TPA: c-type cytochrome domain-containing protein [Gemmatimonadaceae bacterium]|nr:c-type cytochrome domain-containing protein [Gemmatimonadaceae bacterium]
MRARAPLRLTPAPATPASRRITYVAVAIAVAAHGGLLAWANRRDAAPAARRPPAVEGLGAAANMGGMPATAARNAHEFSVVDWENGAPVPGVRVTDVLGGAVVTTDSAGRGALMARPGARFVVRFEKPGFATIATPLANTGERTSRTTVRLEHADVPYALVDTIFIQRCNYCHGAVGHVAGVDLTSYGAVRAGASRFGALVRPHDPDSSRLVRVLVDTLAPDGTSSIHLRRTPRLDAFELATIVEWVREGARHVPK